MKGFRKLTFFSKYLNIWELHSLIFKTEENWKTNKLYYLVWFLKYIAEKDCTISASWNFKFSWLSPKVELVLRRHKANKRLWYLLTFFWNERSVLFRTFPHLKCYRGEVKKINRGDLLFLNSNSKKFLLLKKYCIIQRWFN